MLAVSFTDKQGTNMRTGKCLSCVMYSVHLRLIKSWFQKTENRQRCEFLIPSSTFRAPWPPSTQSCRSWRRWPTTRGRGSRRWCPRCSKTWLRSAWPSEATTLRYSCYFIQTVFSIFPFLLEAPCGFVSLTALPAQVNTFYFRVTLLTQCFLFSPCSVQLK